LWVSLVNFAAITFCVASQRVLVVVVVYSVIDSVRKLLDKPSYTSQICASECYSWYYSCGNASKLYCEGIRFQSLPWHRLSLFSSWFSFVPPGKFRYVTLKQTITPSSTTVYNCYYIFISDFSQQTLYVCMIIFSSHKTLTLQLIQRC